MERSQKRHAYYPVRCPGCGDVVNLLVGNSVTVTVQVHNVPACNGTFYYRCWIERGLPLPRVEFLAPANAMEVMLQPHGGPRPPAPDDPTSAPSPSPRFDLPTDTASPGASSRRASAASKQQSAAPRSRPR